MMKLRHLLSVVAVLMANPQVHADEKPLADLVAEAEQAIAERFPDQGSMAHQFANRRLSRIVNAEDAAAAQTHRGARNAIRKIERGGNP